MEAKFFGFTDLTLKIEELMLAGDRKVLEPLTRDDVIKAIMTTSSNYILRFRVSERRKFQDRSQLYDEMLNYRSLP